MPRTCYVPGCRSGYSKIYDNSVRIFRAPADVELRKKWQQKIQRTDKTLEKNDSVCEFHFQESQIDRFFIHTINGSIVKFPRQTVKLKEGAVPTIFPNCLGTGGYKSRKKQRKVSSEEQPKRLKSRLANSPTSDGELDKTDGFPENSPATDGKLDTTDSFPENSPTSDGELNKIDGFLENICSSKEQPERVKSISENSPTIDDELNKTNDFSEYLCSSKEQPERSNSIQENSSTSDADLNKTDGSPDFICTCTLDEPVWDWLTTFTVPDGWARVLSSEGNCVTMLYSSIDDAGDVDRSLKVVWKNETSVPSIYVRNTCINSEFEQICYEHSPQGIMKLLTTIPELQFCQGYDIMHIYGDSPKVTVTQQSFDAMCIVDKRIFSRKCKGVCFGICSQCKYMERLLFQRWKRQLHKQEVSTETSRVLKQKVRRYVRRDQMYRDKLKVMQKENSKIEMDAIESAIKDLPKKHQETVRRYFQRSRAKGEKNGY